MGILYWQHNDIWCAADITCVAQMQQCLALLKPSTHQACVLIRHDAHSGLSHLGVLSQQHIPSARITMAPVFRDRAGPSWSSINYDGSWKLLHHTAKRFFAPLMVSAEVDEGGHVHVHITSDINSAVEGRSCQHAWQLPVCSLVATTHMLNP